MNEKDFSNLAESVQEADKIKRGQLQASRRFKLSHLHVKAVREKLRKSQAEFARLIFEFCEMFIETLPCRWRLSFEAVNIILRRHVFLPVAHFERELFSNSS
jgi:hypothetical protein